MNTRLPSLKNFDHLEMSVNTSDKRDLNVNLQYRIQFEPLGRKRKPKTENKVNE